MNNHIPKLVKIASWLWISFSVLLLLGTLLNALVLVDSNQLEPDTSIFGWLFSLAGLFFALVFLYIGRQTLKGKAKDTLGNGIGSILFALFGIYSFLGSETPDPYQLIAPVILITAGIMALSGRSGYKQWRIGEKNT